MKRLLIITSCLCLSACSVNTNHGRWSYSGQHTGIFSLFAAEHPHKRARVKEIDPAIATRVAADNARREVERLKAQVNSAQESLSGNRAWQNGDCVKPAMRDLPPRPELKLSDDEINRQSIGHCLDLSARRMSSRKLYEALYSANMDAYWTTYQHWLKSEKQSCARVSRSLMEDWMVENVCAIGGKHGIWSCTQDLILACVKQSTDQCRAPVNSWEREVAAIRVEPDALVKKCHSSLETIADAQRRIPQAEMEATLNAQEHQNIMQNR
jgi:hypothetical protein